MQKIMYTNEYSCAVQHRHSGDCLAFWQQQSTMPSHHPHMVEYSKLPKHFGLDH